MESKEISEDKLPAMYARARKTLANCDWYDEEGKWRTDAAPDEDLVIATMIHFVSAELFDMTFKETATA
jgi:hypothetical protein